MGAAGDKGRILVVDDSEIVLEGTRATLEGAGFAVETLSSPLSLADVIEKKHPDVVLLDITMPALRGDKVVAILEQYGLLKGTTVVLHSGRSEDELRQMAETARVAGFICKEPDPDRLVSQVEHFVRVARAARA